MRDESGVTATQGTSTTSGWTGVVGGDVPIHRVRDLFNIHFSVEYTHTVTTENSTSFPIGQDVNSQQKAIPYIRFHFNRHTVKFRHFEPAGEHKLYIYDPFGAAYAPAEEELHQHQWDVKTSQEIRWNIVPINTPEPGEGGEEPIPNPE